MRSEKETGAEMRLAIASEMVTVPSNNPRSLCESYLDLGSLSSVALVLLIRFPPPFFFQLPRRLMICQESVGAWDRNFKLWGQRRVQTYRNLAAKRFRKSLVPRLVSSCISIVEV